MHVRVNCYHAHALCAIQERNNTKAAVAVAIATAFVCEKIEAPQYLQRTYHHTHLARANGITLKHYTLLTTKHNFVFIVFFFGSW